LKNRRTENTRLCVSFSVDIFSKHIFLWFCISVQYSFTDTTIWHYRYSNKLDGIINSFVSKPIQQNKYCTATDKWFPSCISLKIPTILGMFQVNIYNVRRYATWYMFREMCGHFFIEVLEIKYNVCDCSRKHLVSCTLYKEREKKRKKIN